LEILSDPGDDPEFGTTRRAAATIVIIPNRTCDPRRAEAPLSLSLVDYPDAERELAIVKSRVPNISAKLSQQVVRFCGAARPGFHKSPGCRDHRLGHRADRTDAVR
jgi:hypothetical protein